VAKVPERGEKDIVQKHGKKKKKSRTKGTTAESGVKLVNNWWRFVQIVYKEKN